MASFRLARDIRSYVAEIRGLVHEAGLEVSRGGNAETELVWALAYADRIDPLASWRVDIAKLRAEAASKPCPDCGEVHGGAPTEEAPDGTEAAESEPMA